MLKKRIVGVITVKDGWAVQSFGYARYLPLGRPECLAENLDRWGADEIIVLSIDRSRYGLGPDLPLLRRLGSLGLSTPLTYGGGIASVEAAGAVIQAGADRVCIDAALWAVPQTVRSIAAFLGAQALIGVLPLSVVAGKVMWRDYLAGTDVPMADLDLSLFEERVASEALLIDWRNEGRAGGFNAELVRRFPVGGVPLIVFGGLSEPNQLAVELGDGRVVACAVGNFLAYREHAVQGFRRALPSCPIRPAEFLGER